MLRWNRMRRLAQTFGGLALAGSLLSLAGWVFGIPVLIDWDRNGITIKTNAALSAASAAGAVLLLALTGERRQRILLVRGLAGVVTALGLLTLSEHLVGWNLGIDTLLFTEPAGARAAVAPNRMGPPASTSFFLLGSALLSLTVRWRYSLQVSLACGTSILLVTALSLIGYVYGASELFDIGHLTGIALQTALMLHLLGWAVLALVFERGLTVVLVRPGPGGALARELAFIAVLLPLALGYGALVLQRRGVLSAPLEAASVALITVLILLLFILRTAREVERRATALSESEARYRTVFEQAPIGVLELDPDSGTILRANEAFCRMVGRDAAHLVGRTPTEFTHPDDRAANEDTMATARAGVPFTGQKRYVRPDGGVVHVRVAGQRVETPEAPTRTVAIVADMTAEITAGETIRESEQRFRESLQNSPTCVYMNDADLRYVWVYNPLPGFAVNDMIGRRDDELLPFESVSELIALKHKVLECGVGQRRQIDTTIGGEFAAFDVKVEPWRDAGGAVAGVLVAASNITAIRVADRERLELLESERAARQEAERAARSKDEFVAMMSHELRTPINSILGWSQLLKRAPEGDPARERAIEAIERGVRAQARLVEDLLDMSRIISGKLRLDVQSVNAFAVLGEAIETIKPAAEAKQLRIQPVLDPAAGPVMGDPARLQQIVWNLLANAVKFTPKGGRIQVHLQRVNSHIEISVSDTGVGIASDHLPYIFDRYRQADSSLTRRHGGLGLGLAIVKSLVELHGGSVAAASPGEGLGATFTVQIPVAIVHRDASGREHPSTSDVTAHGMATSSDLSGVHVLIIDDDEDALELARRLLSECGARIDTATSGAEGLARILERPPHVVLCDLGMPEMDGYEVIRRVRTVQPTLPAVAVTAFARAEDRIRAIEAGYNIHISKPVEPRELLAVVAALAKRSAGSA
jgi:PAS domain S-box-containing protein